jgi:hypothetical protein
VKQDRLGTYNIKIVMQNFLKNNQSAIGIFTTIIGIGLFVMFPLLLIWGLMLIGLPVKVTLGSWFGGLLILFFIILASRIAQGVKTK